MTKNTKNNMKFLRKIEIFFSSKKQVYYRKRKIRRVKNIKKEFFF